MRLTFVWVSGRGRQGAEARPAGRRGRLPLWLPVKMGFGGIARKVPGAPGDPGKRKATRFLKGDITKCRQSQAFGPQD